MRVKTDVRILESCTSQGELTVSVFSCVLGALMAIGFYQLGYTEAAWGAALASVPSGICCVGAKVKLLLLK